MKDHPKIRRVDFYADEWLAGTVQLTLQEEGLYWRICSLIYSRGEAITYDMLKSACRNDHGLRVRRGLDKLVRLGKVTQNGDRIDSERCQNEIRNASERIQNAIRNGAKGGRPNGLAKPGGYQLSTINHQVEKEREAKASPKKGSRWAGAVSPEWVGEADRVRLEAGLAPINAALEADKFADYWISKAGAGGLKLNWYATWCNWIRNAKQGESNGRGNGRSSPNTKLYAGFAEAAGYRGANRQADEPLLDGGRSDGDTPSPGRGLDRRPH